MNEKELVKDLSKWLYQNKLFAIEVYSLPIKEIVVSLEGDWKHDHMRCDYLVKQFCDEHNLVIKDMSKDVTHEDGSDYYTADHYYKVEDVKEK